MYKSFTSPKVETEDEEKKEQQSSKNNQMLNLALATEDREAKIASYKAKK